MLMTCEFLHTTSQLNKPLMSRWLYWFKPSIQLFYLQLIYIIYWIL